ncbi:MAG: hypothetical protein ACI85X_000504 [Woeseiaceae bacterium]|jgi:hypothetical protein|tara:strand:+ start:23806 stop:24633 length:828 start_codon:yes stop_codon:yes gene_type:complete
MKIKNIILLLPPHIWINCLTILLCGSAMSQEIKTLPDWSGVWERYEGNGGMFDIATTKPPEGRAGSLGVRQFPPLTEFWEKKYTHNLDLVALDRLPDPISICGTPAGYPRLLALPDVYEFIVREEKTWIITENGPNIMRIYTDGRALPGINERWPTYTGESVGSWDQGVLVFTTVSMIGEKNTVLDRSGLTLSDQAEISTRMFLNEEGLLRAELSIIDPIALTKPWNVIRHFRKLPSGTRIFDYACAENNRNPITSSGKTLTLGPDGIPIDVNFD